MLPPLYADENVEGQLVRALRSRGWDVLDARDRHPPKTPETSAAGAPKTAEEARAILQEGRPPVLDAFAQANDELSMIEPGDDISTMAAAAIAPEAALEPPAGLKPREKGPAPAVPKAAPEDLAAARAGREMVVDNFRSAEENLSLIDAGTDPDTMAGLASDAEMALEGMREQIPEMVQWHAFTAAEGKALLGELDDIQARIAIAKEGDPEGILGKSAAGRADELEDYEGPAEMEEAAAAGRVLLTRDTDFLVIAKRWQATGRHFPGLVYYVRRKFRRIGDIVRALTALAEHPEERPLLDRVHFL